MKTVTHGSHVTLRIHSKDPLRQCCKAKTTSSPSSPSLIPYPLSRLSSSRAAAASTAFTHHPGHGGLECMLNKEFIVIFLCVQKYSAEHSCAYGGHMEGIFMSLQSQKKLYTHLVGDDLNDDETLATFIARHRGKTIAT